MKPRVLLVPLLFVAAMAVADSAYRLDIGATSGAHSLEVEPTVAGPTNKTLRYKIEVRREGGGSSSSQSGSGTTSSKQDQSSSAAGGSSSNQSNQQQGSANQAQNSQQSGSQNQNQQQYSK